MSTALTILVLLTLGSMYWYPKWNQHRVFIRLNKYRSEDEIELFQNHFLELGYETKLIEVVLKAISKVTRNDFIPRVTDSFDKDYKWTYHIIDQFNTKQMLLAGISLMMIGKGNITENDWEDYQKENGKIDSYEDLFNYLELKLKCAKSNGGGLFYRRE